ncbi:Hypothetical protein SRAE_1000100700 [Strongyloides ratti]|uniref:G protein-coupled receptor, rhodopsin-like family and GPCR, rhodopsin-like, 7TM domain-containing protein n=1 Tax=Strongyloides ratti TaxID=34506 RepID=A0A090L3T3_STRRB|nr:Hypothetical protein SRAE_1000100700 [Strongyloides ratti]CEF62737.1 Hypothetical protein SRAE_1000100700 [Strongyloides ratti]
MSFDGNFTSICDIELWNQPVQQYHVGALLVFITLLPNSFINIYFLYFSLKNNYLMKHKFLQYNIIIFSCEYLLAGGNTMLLEGQYLYAYFTSTKIHFWSCAILRTLQQFTLFPIATSTFLLALQRFFIIAWSMKLQWNVLFLFFIIISSPSYINVYLTIFKSKYVIFNEICTFYPVQTNIHLLYFTTFMTSFLPAMALFTNFFTFYLLKRKFKLLKNVSKYEDHKRVLINLSIQSLIPCLSNFPTFTCFFIQIYTHKQIPYLVWRITDVFHYIQYSTSTFITLMSIKEIKKSFFTKLLSFKKIILGSLKK